MKNHPAVILDFVKESNRIENILRPPTVAEFDAFKHFLTLPKITVPDLEHFVDIYQPGARLRDQPGLDVAIGGRYPQRGGPEVRIKLDRILATAYQCPIVLPASVGHPAFDTHIEYEHLHPFTDGNGRSGRALWAWQMQSFPLGFLHTFYYQTLDAITPARLA